MYRCLYGINLYKEIILLVCVLINNEKNLLIIYNIHLCFKCRDEPGRLTWGIDWECFFSSIKIFEFLELNAPMFFLWFC